LQTLRFRVILPSAVELDIERPRRRRGQRVSKSLLRRVQLSLLAKCERNLPASFAITQLHSSSHSTSVDIRREARARRLLTSDMSFTRSNNFDRLESGLGPGRTSRKLGWKKLAIGAAVLIGFVWLLGPRPSVDADLIPGVSCDDCCQSFSHIMKQRFANAWPG
jgi:hypothetical protein